MYIVKLESIGPLTCYICPGDGGHGVMEGYGERWMDNEQSYMSCTCHVLRNKSKLCTQTN